MNNLKATIDNTRDLCAKRADLANMILNGELAADKDEIKNFKLFRKIIWIAMATVYKHGGTVSIKDIQETENYTADYILNELVPLLKEK